MYALKTTLEQPFGYLSSVSPRWSSQPRSALETSKLLSRLIINCAVNLGQPLVTINSIRFAIAIYTEKFIIWTMITTESSGLRWTNTTSSTECGLWGLSEGDPDIAGIGVRKGCRRSDIFRLIIYHRFLSVSCFQPIQLWSSSFYITFSIVGRHEILSTGDSSTFSLLRHGTAIRDCEESGQKLSKAP